MKRIVLLCALLASTSLQAWNCSFEKSIDQTLDLSGSEELAVLAAAGDLEVTGVSNSSAASIKGRICASKEEWMNDSWVETSGGERAEINVQLAETDGGWSFTGQHYVYIDLELEVPDDIALKIRDSSGDVEIDGVGDVWLQDSSGDIEITDISGSATVLDSSGDIEFQDIGQDVIIESDSSGDIRGSDIKGSVLVRKDSSGDIRFNDIGMDFTVERDSSGDISADTVAGDFRVLKDGSGEIRATKVSGEISKPRG